MKNIVLLFFLFPMLLKAQKKEDFGVKFEKNITPSKWSNIFERAKNEGKYVFVYMCFPLNTENDINFFNVYQKPIFEDTAVINFLNSKFINVFVEKSFTKNTSLEANTISEQLFSQFAIRIYPTFLFFDDQGNPVHKFRNSAFPESILLDQAKLAFDKDSRYYSLIKKFENGTRDTTFFKKFFNTLEVAYDSTDKYVLEFIKSRDNLFTRANAEILIQSHSHYVALDYLYNNQNIWRKVIDESVLENFYKEEIRKQVLETYFDRYYSNDKANDLIKIFDEKYPKYGKEASVRFLLGQLKNDKKYIELAQTIVAYLDSDFISKSNPADLNSYAWTVFLNITDTSLLQKALTWSKKSIEQDENPTYLDTYANLLYKLGQKEEAIKYEEKAISLLKNEAEIKSYTIVLEKMKNGEKTWK